MSVLRSLSCSRCCCRPRVRHLFCSPKVCQVGGVQKAPLPQRETRYDCLSWGRVPGTVKIQGSYPFPETAPWLKPHLQTLQTLRLSSGILNLIGLGREGRGDYVVWPLWCLSTSAVTSNNTSLKSKEHCTVTRQRQIFWFQREWIWATHIIPLCLGSSSMKWRSQSLPCREILCEAKPRPGCQELKWNAQSRCSVRDRESSGLDSQLCLCGSEVTWKLSCGVLGYTRYWINVNCYDYNVS